MRQTTLNTYFSNLGSGNYASNTGNDTQNNTQGDDHHSNHPDKKFLIDVWEDTVKCFAPPSGRFQRFRPEPSEVVKSVMRNIVPRYSNTIVSVENLKTLEMAEVLVRSGYKPMVLNMASNFRPGGGVRKGSKAQEEDLFRKTNYCYTLDVNLLPKDTYPLKGLTMIYSPGVTVVKDTNYNDLIESEDYKSMNRTGQNSCSGPCSPFTLDFVACPAVRNPDLKMTGTITDTDPETGEEFEEQIWDYAIDADKYLMKQRIDRMYRLAYTKGHDSVVLGAFGCGAFHNPPQSVAEMFKEANAMYDHCFKFIGFAVYSEAGNPNYDIFRNILLE